MNESVKKMSLKDNNESFSGDVATIKMSELDMSKYAKRKVGKLAVKDVITLTEGDMRRIYSIGDRVIDDIKAALKQIGMGFADETYLQWSTKHLNEIPAMKLDGLSPNTYSVFRRNGIKSIADLVSYSEQELLNMRGLGQISVNTIKKGLDAHGLSLKNIRPVADRETVLHLTYGSDLPKIVSRKHINSIPVQELNLPKRIVDSLKIDDVTTVGQLVSKKESELRCIYGISTRSVAVIKKELAKYSLCLADE